jgi:hypothetical protein
MNFIAYADKSDRGEGRGGNELVTLFADGEIVQEHDVPAERGINKYCEPAEAGLASEAKAVGRRIGHILDALGEVNNFLCDGQINEDCRELRMKMIERLKAEGWRISIPKNSYKVLPPKDR